MVFGPPGVGKTHTIGQVLPKGAVRVELGLGDAVDDLVVGVAGRIRGTEDAIAALRAEDVQGALGALAKSLNGYPLVVDRAERLTARLSAPASDTLATLARDRSTMAMEWLCERAREEQVIAVARGWRAPPREWQREAMTPIQLTAPGSGDLGRSPGIPRERWGELAEATEHNPAALLLMGFSLRLLGGRSEQDTRAAFDTLLDRVGDMPAGRTLDWTASEWLPSAIGEEISAALAVAAHLPGAPREVLAAALTALDVPVETIDTLIQGGILSSRSDGIWILRAVEDAKVAYLLAEKDAERALRAAAQRYLAHVPSRAQPTPASARSLLEAHRLFLEIGDEEEARRTAAFHVGGLIELARRLSVAKKAYREAATLYADIERILDDRTAPEKADLLGVHERARHVGRLRSYVVHYKHYNRHLAGLEGRGDVLEGFRRARALWPENALWYTHEMAVLFAEGRDTDALRLREEAYVEVREHPRRHEFLTCRPAVDAWRAERHITALRLLLLLGLASRDDLALAPAWTQVLGGFSRGVDLPEIPGQGGTRVVFSVPPRATLREAGDTWLFELAPPLDVLARANAPLDAITCAGDKLAAEVLSLVRAYADELTREEQERKVLLLRYVDLLAGSLGLAFTSERWLLGRIDGVRFVPVQQDFAPFDLPETCRPSSEPDKLWFAKVRTHRDGRPTGEILACEPSTGRAPSAERT